MVVVGRGCSWLFLVVVSIILGLLSVMVLVLVFALYQEQPSEIRPIAEQWKVEGPTSSIC